MRIGARTSPRYVALAGRLGRRAEACYERVVRSKHLGACAFRSGAGWTINAIQQAVTGSKRSPRIEADHAGQLPTVGHQADCGVCILAEFRDTVVEVGVENLSAVEARWSVVAAARIEEWAHRIAVAIRCVEGLAVCVGSGDIESASHPLANVGKQAVVVR